MKRPQLVFVAGGSGSGKTRTAQSIVACLIAKGVKARLVSMDHHYRPQPLRVMDKALIKKDLGADATADEVSAEQARRIAQYRSSANFDTPDMIDFAWVARNMQELVRGVKTARPNYCFERGNRVYERDDETGELLRDPLMGKPIPVLSTIPDAEVYVIEGLFALHDRMDLASIPRELRTTVIIDADSYLLYKKRRLVRDPAERDMDEALVKAQEKRHVGPGYFHHICPTRTNAEFTITVNYDPSWPDDQPEAIAQHDQYVAAQVEALVAHVIGKKDALVAPAQSVKLRLGR